MGVFDFICSSFITGDHYYKYFKFGFHLYSTQTKIFFITPNSSKHDKIDQIYQLNQPKDIVFIRGR